MTDTIILPKETELYNSLHHLVTAQWMVFFAGLPGVGKSLLLQQLAHMAHAAGRTITLLQWDVSRLAFETDEILAQYPEKDGVTHGIVRKALGLWARDEILRWHKQNNDENQLLIGETPFVGNRFIEVAQSIQDDAEALLQAPKTRFVIPVPTLEIRQMIEGERERRNATPQHEREKGDAPPHVLRALWVELYQVAFHLGLSTVWSQEETLPYDPDIYAGTYQALLKHRHCEVVSLDIRLDTANRSVYDFDVQIKDLAPSPEEVEVYLQRAEKLYPDEKILQKAMATWYEV